MKKSFAWLTKDIWGFSLTSFFNDFSHEMTTSLLPTLVQEITGTAAPLALGIIAGVSNGVSTALKLFSGWLTDQVEHYKPIVALGYFITPFFSSLMGAATHVWQLFLLKTFAWAGRGLREPMRDAWLSSLISPHYYGSAFGFQRALDTLGAVFGPLTVLILLQYVTVRSIFYISFIPGLLSVLFLILLVKDYKKKIIPTDKNKELNFTALPTNFIYFVFVMFIFGLGNFNKTFLIYRSQTLLTGTTGIFWAIALYSFFNIVRAISEYLMGTLSDYVSRVTLLIFFGFGLFATSAALLLVTTDQFVLWLLIFILAGISTGTITALEKAQAATLLPLHIRGRGFGILQATDGLADLISSIVVGFIWNVSSAYWAFLYAFILSISALVLSLKFCIFQKRQRIKTVI